MLTSVPTYEISNYLNSRLGNPTNCGGPRNGSSPYGSNEMRNNAGHSRKMSTTGTFQALHQKSNDLSSNFTVALLACLISRSISINKQYFPLTINQRPVLSAMAKRTGQYPQGQGVGWKQFKSQGTDNANKLRCQLPQQEAFVWKHPVQFWVQNPTNLRVNLDKLVNENHNTSTLNLPAQQS